MSTLEGARTLIAGIGSPHGDDRAGWQVIDELRARLASARPPARPLDLRTYRSPVDLLGDLVSSARFDRLIVCDAFWAKDSAGVRRWVWPDVALRQPRFSGSHDVPLAEVLALAGALGILPREVEIQGLAIRSARPAQRLSPHVHDACRRWAADLERLVVTDRLGSLEAGAASA